MRTESLLLGGVGLALGALALDRFNKADIAGRQALMLTGVPGQQITMSQTKAQADALVRETIGYGIVGAALLGLAFYTR